MKKIITICLILFVNSIINGQELASDVFPGASGSNISELIEFNGKLFFYGRRSSSEGSELLSFDENTSTINLEAEIYTSSQSSNIESMVIYNNKLYLSAQQSSGQKNLYSYDGTNLVKIAPNTSSVYKPSARESIVVNGKLYFSGNDGSNSSLRYLHTYDDATPTSATPPYTRVNITGESNTANFNPRDLVRVGNVLYFIAEHSTAGTKVFFYNTVNSNSGFLTSISSPENMAEYAGSIYLKGNLTAPSQFIKIDVSNSNAISLLSGNPGAPKTSNIVGHQNTLYYTTDNGTFLNGLGIYDLNTGAYRFINSAPNNSQISNIIKHGGNIYFEAFFTNKGLELGEYNTTTKVLRGLDLLSGSSDGFAREGYSYNGKLYFTGIQLSSIGQELYKYDGNPMVPEIFVPTNLTYGTDWSLASNWSNGLPNENTEANILNGINAVSNITGMKAKKLVLENGSSLTLTSNASLEITNGFTNNGTLNLENASTIKVLGNAINSTSKVINLKNNSFLEFDGQFDNTGLITLESDQNGSSSLIVKGSFSGVGLTYKRYVSNQWHLISTPVNGMSLDDIISNTPLASGTVDVNHVGLAGYNNNLSESWNYYTSTPFLTTVGMRGYAIKRSSAGTVNILGTFRQASQLTIALTRGAESNWNLVGNPYTSFLAANTNAHATLNLLTENSTDLDPNFQALYFWDPTANSGNGEYKIINQMSPAQHVAPGQGFFVQIKNGGGNFTFAENMQSHQTGNIFHKNSNTVPEINLKISNGISTKTTDIKYLSSSTKGLDPGYDAGQFNGTETGFNIYTQLVENNKGINFGLQVLPDDYENIIIPIGVKATANSEIVFTINHNSLPSGIKIFLEDKLTNSITRLGTQGSEYKITTTSNINGTGRFYLHTSTQTVLNIDKNDLEYVNMFNNNRLLNISGLNEQVDIKIFDLLGKQTFSLENKQINNSTEIIIPNHIKPGIYIVNLKTKNGTSDKKIILE